MATRETRLARGRRQGRRLRARMLEELRGARVVSGLSQRTMARELGCTQTAYWRFESARVDIDIVRLAEAAAILGLELSAALHPAGEAIRDAGQQHLLRRLRDILSPRWRALAEVPLPGPGDPRSWDMLLRIEGQLVGVEAETRVRDVQALVRRIRQRQRDGGVDEVILVLSDSAANRRLADELREALGPRFVTSPRAILAALRAGQPSPGSGVVLL